ncbi:Protein O-linked-mannose beta-1,4-N-acetylglucosaminyltransferase 2 [Entophlyctis luteolus]|nr:Protein O-linked-mannose beta-1,4-N-acetylglucosaminyltransferase 2 [Entophlyctis luteolus]
MPIFVPFGSMRLRSQNSTAASGSSSSSSGDGNVAVSLQHQHHLHNHNHRSHSSSLLSPFFHLSPGSDPDDAKFAKSPRFRRFLLRHTASLRLSFLLISVFVAGGLIVPWLFSDTLATSLFHKSPYFSAHVVHEEASDATDWRRKYEDLVSSLGTDYPLKLKEQSASSGPDSKASDSAPANKKESAPNMDQDKEKERQMKELMKQSDNSAEGVKLKESESKPMTDAKPQIELMEIRDNSSVLIGLPTIEEENRQVRRGVVEISTIEDHPYTAWWFEHVSKFVPEFQNRQVRYHKDFTILFKRFHGNNIMHSLHDDVIPLFHHIREYLGGYMELYDYFEFDLRNHKLQFTDDYDLTETFRPFQYLSDVPVGQMKDLNEDPNLITCFRDATAGVRKLTTWYQYGFGGPQGPIKSKFVNGYHVRQVANFFIGRLGLPMEDYYNEKSDAMYNAGVGRISQLPQNVQNNRVSETTGVTYIGEDLIIILSRTRNRLILNEAEFAQELERKFKHQVMLVRNEDHSFEEQIILMRRAKVVIAMHGSILIMGMFCRKGTVILELYPWAVPSENYTPYKTMAELHGMGLVYRAWENKHPENSVSHPDWSSSVGGISELPIEEQEKILNTDTVPPHLCCVDPYWLFRIYQDTIVDIPEVTALLIDGLEEARNRFSATIAVSETPAATAESIDDARNMVPPLIVGPDFSCIGDDRPDGSLWVRWNEPWNGARPDKYIVRARIDGADKEDGSREYFVYFTDTNELFVPGFEKGMGIIFSVKAVVGALETEFGDEAICFV